MEPISTVTGALQLAKSAADISKKLNEVWKTVKDRESKQQIEAILDNLHDLKHSAAALEDENRELREKLRFNDDDYEFLHPFRYKKSNRAIALCPKCFSNKTESPMGNPGQGCADEYRKCLVCGHEIQVDYINEVSYTDSNPGEQVF